MFGNLLDCIQVFIMKYGDKCIVHGKRYMLRNFLPDIVN